MWCSIGSTEIKGEEVIELGAGCGQVDFVRKDAGTATLQKEKNICTQWLAEKRVWALAICGRGIWDAHDGSWWTRRQEGCLQEGPLDLLKVGLPELKVPTRNQGGSDGIVKDVFYSKLGDDAGLVVRYAKFFGHLMTFLWRKDVGRFDWSVGEKEKMLTMYGLLVYKIIYTTTTISNVSNKNRTNPRCKNTNTELGLYKIPWFLTWLRVAVHGSLHQGQHSADPAGSQPG